MPDREKVIKGLECCTRYEVGKQLNNCLDCPYVEPIGFNQFRCKSQDMKEDALALLKEKDPVEPEWEGGGSHYWHVCGECHGVINSIDSYCRHCGRRIKWDGN